jgi:K+-sensing histidine kinase KdpD
MTRYLTRDRAAIAAAMLGPLALAAILLPWRGSWPNTNVALLLVVAIVAIACLGNRLAGALAAISAAVWFDFFFTLPYDRLTISHSADVTTFVLLLTVGVAVSQMAAWARRLKAVTAADAGYFSRILASAVLAEEMDTPDDVVEHVRGQLIEVLDLENCRFEYGKLQYIGRFMLTPKPGCKPSQRARVVAVALAGLAGYAIGASSARAA